MTQRPEDRLFVIWRRTGDADALAQVYDRTASSLLRIAMHHVRHPASAEDLVQATFLAAIQGAAAYDPTRPLIGWLTGIVHNQVKWLMRREGRVVDPGRLPDRPPADPLAVAQASEFTAQVDDAVGTLPEVYQPVLRLHLKHQLTAAEIAHVLDRPPGTVRSQVVRGLELLRQALPAGIGVAAFAVLLPERGLAGVREAVLAEGAAVVAARLTAVVGAGGTAAMVGGVVAMKKVLIGAAAALVLAAGVFWSVSAASLPGRGTVPDVAPSSAAASAQALPVGEGLPPDAVAGGTRRSPVAPLAPEWRLVGRVHGPDGRPFDGATVRVGLHCDHESEPLAEVATDADGRYSVDVGSLRVLPPIDLARAGLAVSAWGKGHHEATAQVALPHRDPVQRLVVEHDLQLVRGAILTGRVVDEQARGVAGAWVALRIPPADSWTNARSDAEGRYRIGAADSGPVAVVARHDGHGLASSQCVLKVGEDRELPDLVLRPTATLRGRLVFEDSEPAAGIEVRAGTGSTTTDRDGRFVIGTLAPGRYPVQLVALDDPNREVGALETGEPEATLVLAGLHDVRVAFADEAGRALRSMQVGYHSWAAEHDAALAAFAAGDVLPRGMEDGWPGGAGWVRSLPVPSGTWLWIQASHGDAHGEALVHAVPPQNVIEARVTLRRIDRDALLRLVLKTSDGSAPGEFTVRLRQIRLGEPGVYEPQPENGAEGPVYRGYPGRFRVEVFPKVLDATFGWFAPFERLVDLRAGTETVLEEALTVGGRVRLQVQLPDTERRAIPGFAVETPAAADLYPGWRRGFVRSRPGAWTLGGEAWAGEPLLWRPLLPPGRHLLTIRSRDHAAVVVAVHILPREVTDVQVHLLAR